MLCIKLVKEITFITKMYSVIKDNNQLIVKRNGYPNLVIDRVNDHHAPNVSQNENLGDELVISFYDGTYDGSAMHRDISQPFRYFIGPNSDNTRLIVKKQLFCDYPLPSNGEYKGPY